MIILGLGCIKSGIMEGELVSLLDGISTIIKEWNKNFFGNIFKLKKEKIWL